jgi:hypothetical protein
MLWHKISGNAKGHDFQLNLGHNTPSDGTVWDGWYRGQVRSLKTCHTQEICPLHVEFVLHLASSS